MLSSECSSLVPLAASTVSFSMHGFCGRAFNSFCFPLLHSHFRSQFRSVLHSHSRCFASVVVDVLLDMLGVKHDVTCLFVHCVKSRMSSTCFSCRLHSVIHHSSCARAFDFFCFLPSCFIISCFPFTVLLWLLFPSVVSMKVAMTHLWSLPCGSRRWLRRLCNSSIVSWLICSRFVSRYFLEI